MAIQVLPPKRTGGQAFTEAFNPYIQQAFLEMLKRQAAQQQYQQNIQQTNQMFPGLMTQVPQTAETSMGQVPVRPNPKIPPQYQFNMEQAQKYPGLSFSPGTGVSEYKVPTPDLMTQLANYQNLKQNGALPENFDITGVSGKNISIGRNVPGEKLDLEKQEKVSQLEEKSNFIIQQAQDSLDTIAEVKKGIEKGYFGLYGVVPAMPGTEKYTWQSNIDKLLSGKMIELMTKMKEASKTGATGFGQLSEREGQVLRDASTALKRGLAPQEAKKILDVMETSLQKVVSGSQQLQGQGQGMQIGRFQVEVQ